MTTKEYLYIVQTRIYTVFYIIYTMVLMISYIGLYPQDGGTLAMPILLQRFWNGVR